MKTKFIGFAAFAAMFSMALTSCSNNEDDLAQAGAAQIDAKKLITTNANIIGASSPRSVRSYDANVGDIQADGMLVWAFDATRETAITDAADFFMGAPTAGLEHRWNDAGYFKADKDYFWPEYKLNFVAITPRTGGGIGDVNISQAAKTAELQKPVMTVKVDVPRTTSESDGTYGEDNQKDIMIASIEDKQGDGNSAAFTFKHALSQIVFKGCVDATTTIHKAVVKSIKLVNVASDGTITYTAATDAFAADNQGTQDKTYAANIKNKEVTAKSGKGTNDITGQDDNAEGRDYQLMIMPQTSVTCTGITRENLSQTTAPTAGTYLLVNADIYANGNNSNKVISSDTNVYIPLESTTWEPGCKYTYVLKFGDNLLHPITFTATVAAWTNADKNVEY